MGRQESERNQCHAYCVQECEDLVEVQVAARLERLREVEVAAARQEAAAK